MNGTTLSSNPDATVIINGTTPDKGLCNSILEFIANDRHIQSTRDFMISYSKKKRILQKSKVIIEGSGIGYPGFMNWAQLGQNLDQRITEALIGLYTLFIIFTEITSRQIDALMRESYKYNISYDDLKTKNNFNYWKYFHSNLSDAQTLNCISSISKSETAVDYIFGAEPYYKNVYIDSIVVDIKTNENFKNKKKIHSFLTAYLGDLYCIENLKDNFEVIVDSLKKQNISFSSDISERIKFLLSDRDFFGTQFLSAFLMSYSTNKGVLEEIYFEVGDKLKNKNGGINPDGVFAREMFLLAGNPGKMKFSSDLRTPRKNLIRIIEIQKLPMPKGLKKDAYISQSKKRFDELFFAKSTQEGFIRLIVPIKKIISIPNSSISKLIQMKIIPNEYDKNIFPLPEIIIKTDKKTSDGSKKGRKKKINVFSIGGAEHNLPLVYLINIMRYKGKDDRLFGFVENYFDIYLKQKNNKKYQGQKKEPNPEFMMSLQKQVSGMNRQIKFRPSVRNVEEQAREAEILKITFNTPSIEINGYAIYGFSAPMTRYAFLTLMYALDKTNSSLFKKYHNKAQEDYFDFIDKNNQIIKNIGCYSLGNNPEEYVKLRDLFDELDVMNNSNDNKVKEELIKNMSVSIN